MNILVYRYNSICEPPVIEAFKTFGCSVDELTTEMTQKNLMPSDYVQIVSEKMSSKSYDAVFSINFFPYVSEVCNIYKIPYICWTVDCPILELYTKSVHNPYNRIFLFDYKQYEEIHALNPECTYYLPLAANVSYYDSVIEGKFQKKFAHDLCFIGSLYTEKNPFEERSKSLSERNRGYLDALMEAQLKIYGYNFIEDCITEDLAKSYFGNKGHLPEGAECGLAKVLAQNDVCSKIATLERQDLLSTLSEYFTVDMYTMSDTSPLPKVHFHGQAKTLTEMPLIFNESKINLNFTLKSIQTGLPLRIFDIMGCGGFVLTNYQSEIPEYFNIGEHLETFGSKDELIEKVDYYLNHEKERQQIARAGYEEVKAKHTWIHRCSQILTTVFKY